MYLIDTNILSEARRGTIPAVRWIENADPAACFFSVITLGEVVKGAAMKRRTDPAAAVRLDRWLDRLRLAYNDRILPVSDAVAVEWGRLIAIRACPTADALIAATAIAHRLSLVTRNTAEFGGIDVPIVDPFAA